MEAYTVGVEEEYQLVDPSTCGLVSRARDVLAMDWAGEAEHEVQETQLEIATRICASAAEVDAELRRLRFQMASLAAARDLTPVAAGLHPFSRWEEQSHTDAPRYHRLIERYGRVIESEHVFGMHVHVAVPESMDRMRVVNRMRPYLPHLLALSASSPFFEGRDTRYASYRTILNDRLPCSGPPPAFDSEPEYWAFTAELISLGTAVDEGTTYWTVRPHHRYPTIEVRCADVCPRVDDAVAIAALVRVIAAAAAEEMLPDAAADRADPSAAAIHHTNHWQAARFGLDARIRDPQGGGAVEIVDSLRALLERLAPLADRLGDAAELSAVDDLLGRGNGASRMRAAATRAGDLTGLVGWLAGETLLGTGMDRRTDQRRAFGGAA